MELVAESPNFLDDLFRAQLRNPPPQLEGATPDAAGDAPSTPQPEPAARPESPVQPEQSARPESPVQPESPAHHESSEKDGLSEPADPTAHHESSEKDELSEPADTPAQLEGFVQPEVDPIPDGDEEWVEPIRLMDLEPLEVAMERELERPPDIEDGQVYASLDLFKAAFVRFVMATRTHYYTRDSWREHRFIAVCVSTTTVKEEDGTISPHPLARPGVKCGWQVRAFPVGDSGGPWVVKTARAYHDCRRVGIQPRTPHARFLADFLMPFVRKDPTMAAKQIIDHVKDMCDVELSYQSAYGTLKTIQQRLGNMATQRAQQLDTILKKAVEVDPLAVTDLHVEGKGTQQQTEQSFWCPSPMVNCFMNSKPVVTLDACHVRGPHDHIIMVACFMDMDGKLAPLAWGLAPLECEATWERFCGLLARACPGILAQKIPIVSDGDNGLDTAVRKHFPTTHHLMCCQRLLRKILDNCCTCHGGAAAELFAEAARVGSKDEFWKLMVELKSLSRECLEYIMGRDGAGTSLSRGGLGDKSTWARAFSPVPRFGIMTTNMVKTFSKAVKEAWGMPAPHLMHWIARWCATFLHQGSLRSASHRLSWVPSAMVLLGTKVAKARKYEVKLTGPGEGEVADEAGELHRVSLAISADGSRSARCSCGGSQDQGLPCSHACAVIMATSEGAGGDARASSVEEFFAPLYSTARWQQAFAVPMHLGPSGLPLLPGTGAGRRRGMKRKRAEGEGEEASANETSPPEEGGEAAASGGASRRGRGRGGSSKRGRGDGNRGQVCSYCKGAVTRKHNKATCPKKLADSQPGGPLYVDVPEEEAPAQSRAYRYVGSSRLDPAPLLPSSALLRSTPSLKEGAEESRTEQRRSFICETALLREEDGTDAISNAKEEESYFGRTDDFGDLGQY